MKPAQQTVERPLMRATISLIVLLAGLATGMGFLVHWLVGVIILVIVILGGLIIGWYLRQSNRGIRKFLTKLSQEVEQTQQEALLEMPIGVILLDDQNIIKWINPYMSQYFPVDGILVGRKLAMVDSELAKLVAKYRHDDTTKVVSWQARKFEFLVQDRVNAVYLTDITDYEAINERYQREQLFLGNIYLDNYAEIIQGMSDSAVSNLHNYVTSELMQWAKQHELLLKVVDDDNFLLIGHDYSLKQLESENFNVLDTIRKNTSQQNSPVTISMGISYGQSDLMKLAAMAQKNLDLALGRGGDQVVVRSESGQAQFYGGKTNPMEKRTRVRSRMISQALQDLMTQADQIFIMGHTAPDLDSVGATLGIRRLAEMNQHESWIVMNQAGYHSDIQRLMGELDNYQELKSRIITPEEALKRATDDSLLVMVDHSKPSLSISPALTERLANRLVIIDHHRRGEEFPANPLLVYIEAYASSTCELITEMFEYQPRESRGLAKIEATVMLAGIRIDTKSFSQNAGTRTFDAASYLRSAGADGELIQRLIKESPTNFMQRNHLIDTVEFWGDRFAVCVGQDDELYDPVLAAQAADMLLQVTGIEASFVIVRIDNETIAMSARALGEFNVQVVMEKLGGGGHHSKAAAQIKDQSVAEVKQALQAILMTPTETTDEVEETE
ncbi:Phosphoesterase RecJ domain-containing protein [Limosilactobacillus equigenerosi DSM 18793 = JCM 14505]|uniref:Cyclic-di-AMP phosphodiesterase n=2 Tax=Limosilactobacillus TaxID=2742598 RepID=A0A0R1UVZ9_9LACO|nr:Phosphoesterase RecJ domain-containing protein [Limosilactobacillus equigenerosi DSM 18793 = JCM 14505]